METNMFNSQGQTNESDRISRLLRSVAQYIVIGVCGLSPLLFLPMVYVPLGYTKTIIVVVAMAVALLLLCLCVLREGVINLTVSKGMIALWALTICTCISAFLSGDVRDSFIGDGFGVNTAAFLLLIAVITSMMHLLRSSKASIMRLYILLVLSALLLSVFHIIRLVFGSDVLTFGVFQSLTVSPLGGWNDLALYFGLTLLLAMVAIEQLPLTKVGRFIIGLISAFALIMLAVVNFFAVWLVLAFVSVVVLTYSLSKRKFKNTQLTMGASTTHPRTSLALSLLVFVVSILFIIGGSSLGTAVSSATGVSFTEVRPSVSATVSLAGAVYENDPVFGIGPNKFIDAWRLYKDPAINQTEYWDTDFEGGSGYITTALTTNGSIVALLWIVFFGMLLYSAARMLLRPAQTDRFWNFIGMSSLVSTLYFWCMSVFFTPAASTLILTAICTGIFFTAYSALIPQRSFTFSARQNRNAGFILIGFATFLIFTSISAAYFSVKHYGAVQSFNKAVDSMTTIEQLDEVESAISEAFERSANDAFARQIASYHLILMSALLQIENPSEQELNEFQNAAAKSSNAINLALANDPSERANHQLQGQIYSVLAIAGFDGALERAENSLNRASDLDPHNPVLPLLLAQLHSRVGQLDSARSLAEKAVTIRGNYLEALSFLTDLDITEGKVQEAINHTEAIIALEPDNPAQHYQLGVLESSLQNIERAILAFEAAIRYNPGYANARYTLALAYIEQGRIGEAIAQLEVVKGLSPDNQQVQSIIDQLRSGELQPAAASSASSVAEPEIVSETSDGQVTSTVAPDTSLISPLNVVPDIFEDDQEAAIDGQ